MNFRSSFDMHLSMRMLFSRASTRRPTIALGERGAFEIDTGKEVSREDLDDASCQFRRTIDCKITSPGRTRCIIKIIHDFLAISML